MRNVAIIAENSVDYVRVFTENLEREDTTVLIDWRLPDIKIVEIVKELKVEKLFCDPQVSARLNNRGLNGISITLLKKDEGISPIPDDIIKKWESLGLNYSENTAVILFSSGTTGAAKGVKLSYRAINNNSDSIIDYIDRDNVESILVSKTFSHSSTIVGEIIVALKLGLSIHIAPSITQPKTILDYIAFKKIDMYCINPSMLYLLLLTMKKSETVVNELHYLYVSGSRCSKDLLQKASSLFPQAHIHNVYGATEVGPRITAQRSKYDTVGSVGTPIKNVEVEVVSESGMLCENGDIGIVHVKTNSLMTGYSNCSEPRVSLYEGWYNTGDLGYKNKNGELFLVGRFDNMIISAGHNVFPETVEEVVEMIDSVNECMVYGNPDSMYGEKIVCLYSLRDKSLCELSKEKMRAFCKNYLAPYEIPHDFICVESIEKTTGGKKKRKQSVNEAIS
ncbi:MAG: acyl--CoA ligase [Clostridiales bacterium]|nr:acyl--CoA ligase [Clostridiales bacterium]